MGLDFTEPKPSRRRRHWDVLALAALSGGLLLAGLVVRHDVASSRDGLLQHSQDLASTQDGRTLVTASDPASPARAQAIERLESRLANGCAAHPACRRIALWTRTSDGDVSLLADSRRTGEGRPAGPETDPAIVEAFTRKASGRPLPMIGANGDETQVLTSVLSPRGHPVEAVAEVWFEDPGAILSNLSGGLPLAVLGILVAGALTVGSRLLPHLIRGKGTLQRWCSAEILLTFLFGIGLTLAAAWMAYQHEAWIRRELFSHLARGEAIVLNEALVHTQLYGIESLALFFESSVSVDRQEFSRFSGPHGEFEQVGAWYWAPRIDGAARSDFERGIRNDGLPDYSIWERDAQRRRIPAETRDWYLPIVYALPETANGSSLGLDLGQDPMLRVALETAVASGLVTSSDSDALAQDTGNPAGMILVLAARGPSERENILGFALAMIHFPSLLEVTLAPSSTGPEPVVVTDLWRWREGQPDLLASTRSFAASPGGNPPRPDTIPILTVPVAEETLTIHCHPGPGFARLYPFNATVPVASTGLTLTLAVTLLVGAYVNRRSLLESALQERTKRLRQTELLLAETLRSIGEGVIRTDGQGAVTGMNEVAEELTGWKTDEALGRPAVEIFRMEVPGSGQESEHPVTAVTRTGRVVAPRQGAVLHSRAGTLVEVAPHCAPVFDPSGALNGTVLVFRNVGVERNLQRAVEAQKEFLRQVIDTVPAFVCVRDSNGRIELANRAYAESFGTSVDSLEGASWNAESPVSPEDPRFVTDDRHVIHSRNPVYIPERKATFADGTTHWISTTRIPLVDGDGFCFRLLVVGIDITERKTAEAERERLQQQLLQAQKLDSVGRLAGGIAHDFNNKLQAILGQTELLLDRLQPLDPLREELNEIRTAAARSAELTHQLLAFAQKQTAVPEILDLNHSVEGLTPLLREMVGEGVRLTWLPKADLWPVRIDPSQVRQILSHLCVNARETLPPGSEIRIETGNVVLGEAHHAAGPDVLPGDYVMLSFSDNGPGLAPEEFEHLWEPFYTAKGLAQGLARGIRLGLPTVYGIIRQNLGFVDVISAPGEGTCFRICFPRHLEGDSEADLEQGTRSLTGTETILLVEDEISILELAESMLTRLGYRVLSASSPKIALSQVAGHAGPIDLLLTDVVMPEMNGRQLGDILTSRDPRLQVLFMSGYSDNIVAKQGIVEEGMHFLNKPFSLRTLAQAVRKVLDGRRDSDGSKTPPGHIPPI